MIWPLPKKTIFSCMIMSIVSSSIELYVDTEDESEIHVHIYMNMPRDRKRLRNTKEELK